MNPIVQNSQHPLKGDLLYCIERILKLSVPNLYVWLCMFYCFFHLWYVILADCFSALLCIIRSGELWTQFYACRLNILAELLRFGDREFYKAWWNAKTVDEVGQFFGYYGCRNISTTRTKHTANWFFYLLCLPWPSNSHQYWRLWNMVCFLTIFFLIWAMIRKCFKLPQL